MTLTDLFTHGLWNNELPKFEQGRGAVTTLIFTKIVSNVDLKPLTILAKRSTIDAWLVPEHASAGGYTVKFSLTASKGDIILMNTLHLKFRLINCLSISWPLKQLSKVVFSGTFVWKILCKLLLRHLWQRLIKVPCFQHIVLNTFGRLRRKYEFIVREVYNFRHSNNIQVASSKYRSKNTLSNKSCKSYFCNKK